MGEVRKVLKSLVQGQRDIHRGMGVELQTNGTKCKGNRAYVAYFLKKKRWKFRIIWYWYLNKGCVKGLCCSLHSGPTPRHQWEKCVSESASGGEREETVGESWWAILEIKTGPTQRHMAHFDKHKHNGSQGREGNDATFTLKLLKLAKTGDLQMPMSGEGKKCCTSALLWPSHVVARAVSLRAFLAWLGLTLMHLHLFVCTRKKLL